MGNAVSRDHAKLPFGYTHARKDHAYNTSSVSRKRLASRLLRTSDTTSITPFPIQDTAASSSVSSIPDLTTTYTLPSQNSSHLQHHQSLFSSSHNHSTINNSSLPLLPPVQTLSSASSSASSSVPIANIHGQSSSHSSSGNSHPNSDAAATTALESGTGTGSTSPVPESDAVETNVVHSAAISPLTSPTQSFSDNTPTLTATTSATSLAWTLPATTTTTATSTSTNRYEQEAYSSIDQKQRLEGVHSMRTQEEQDSDMDIISALGIADHHRSLPHRSHAPSLSSSSYDFFGNANVKVNVPLSPPARSSSLRQPYAQQQQHQQMLTTQDSMALLVSNSRVLLQQQQRQGADYETRMGSTDASAAHPHLRSDFRGHPSFSKRALTYELKGGAMSERELQQLQEEEEEEEDGDDEILAEGGAGAGGWENGGRLWLERTAKARGDEADSLLDEDVEQLSPIPFSELPSLTNIGLCSHGIVKLSSNIRLLASATCVQICCNELSAIPMEIGFLRNLTLLDLSKNRLTALPESIMHLTKLVDLKLSMNQLESIPSGIGGLTKLASLALDSNRLESVPSQIGLIKGLVNLDLSHNPITVLPAEIGKLQFLRRLTLAHCPLVEEFSHSPLHSPPTLLELAARVIVRHSVPTPRMILPHLKTYLKSARTCTFCDGPYFDTFVKRGKMIEKNDLIIPLEYTLCEPHWNTELERIKLLFCPRPLTSPPPPTKANATTLQGTQSSTMRNGQVARKQSSRTNSNSANSSSLALNSNTGMGSGAALNNNGSRPANRKYASERPMSTMGGKLSTFLSPKNGDSSTNTSGSGSSNNNTSKRERPATGLRTSSVPLVTATLASSAAEAATAAPSSLISSPLSSAFSSAPMTPSSETGEEAAIMPRPRVRRAGTSGLLARAASKLRRPLSMASALALEGEEEVGQSDGTRAD